jgi:diguanylate cyclase (GGDEF)-like protein
MPDARIDQSWGTSQLVEFLAVLSGQSDGAQAAQAAVERVLESLDADIGVLLNPDHSTAVVVGLSADDQRLCPLLESGLAGESSVDVKGLGECRTATAALGSGAPSQRLFVARLGTGDFTPADLLLLRGMAWVLDLAGRQLQMLSALNERQRVLEHVARVQRGIVARVPLPEVFDNVTESTLSLVGSEYAMLHLLDRDGLAVVSVNASPDVAADGAVGPVRPPTWALRMSAGLAEEVYQRDELVHTGDGSRASRSRHSDVDDAVRIAMGAPVRENGTVVGSLVVISPANGNSFADAQQQALRTFADQVSVAMSDAKAQLAAQHAVRDPVTGLPNRVLFLDQLESAVAAGRRVHVLFLDLDRFKHVNDTRGHAVGDDLLRKVGRRLRETLRGAEVLARFGGDEYAILLEDTTDAQAHSCAERLLVALQLPFLIGDEPVVIGGSIGVAGGGATGCGAAVGDGGTATEVLRNADTAMYRAKHSGGGRIVIFAAPPGALLTHSVETDLRRAVEDNGLAVVFQPIVGLRDGRLHAAEALVRWNHPIRGPVPPADFIPLAEETGLIMDLGRQVLQSACAQAVAWPTPADRAGPPPSVSVNVSARQLHDPGFLSDVRRVLADTRLDPDRLILEITESTMVSDLDTVLELMLRLREMGVRLAIDDFGTGYSSLSYLRMFPVEILKIDRSFVEGIVAPWQGRAFVQAIVRLAHALSMTTVAEGVESEDQVAALLEVGCEIGQGFLLARPMPSADIVALTPGLAPVVLSDVA